MNEPRTYVAGLPVLITVHDDGTVEYEVDTSEAREGAYEFYCEANHEITEEQMLADLEAIELDRDRKYESWCMVDAGGDWWVWDHAAGCWGWPDEGMENGIYTSSYYDSFFHYIGIINSHGVSA